MLPLKVSAALTALDQGKLTKQELVKALQKAHSEHGTETDPCELGAFKAHTKAWTPEDLHKVQQAAEELQTYNTLKADALHGVVDELLAAAKTQDPGTESEALRETLQQLDKVKKATNKLAEMDPDSGKPRSEVLHSVHTPEAVQGMSSEQKSAAFREIGRSRIAARRAEVIAVSEAILVRSKQPTKAEEIHAVLATADALGRDGKEKTAKKAETDRVSDDLKQCLEQRKLQHEVCQKMRQKSAEEKAKAHTDLRKALEELLRAASAHVNAVTKLHAQDAALDLLLADIEHVEGSLTTCT